MIIRKGKRSISGGILGNKDAELVSEWLSNY